jgi:hypothetical protein
MFNTIDLSPQQRESIKARYHFLMRSYRRRCWLYSYLFYILRMTMTVGSLAVPALLSLPSSTNLGGPAGTTYWLTWGISLAVTTANGILTLFKLDKRFFALHATAERLRTETWQYLSLSGRYSGHYGTGPITHESQYIYYCWQVERIHMNQMEEEFIKNADLEGTNQQANGKNAPSTAAASAGHTVPTPATQAGTTVPSPQGAMSEGIQSMPPSPAGGSMVAGVYPLSLNIPPHLAPIPEDRIGVRHGAAADKRRGPGRPPKHAATPASRIHSSDAVPVPFGLGGTLSAPDDAGNTILHIPPGLPAESDDGGRAAVPARPLQQEPPRSGDA